jgi:hypothetical protein
VREVVRTPKTWVAGRPASVYSQALLAQTTGIAILNSTGTCALGSASGLSLTDSRSDRARQSASPAGQVVLSRGGLPSASPPGDGFQLNSSYPREAARARHARGCSLCPPEATDRSAPQGSDVPESPASGKWAIRSSVSVCKALCPVPVLPFVGKGRVIATVGVSLPIGRHDNGTSDTLHKQPWMASNAFGSR